MSDVCPKCGFDSNQPDSVECPSCGVVFFKYRRNQEKAKSGPPTDDLRKEEEAEPEGIPSIDFRSKVLLVGILLVILYVIGSQWYGYLSERNILLNGLRAIGKVTHVRRGQLRKPKQTYALYMFHTASGTQIQGKCVKGKFRQGDLIEIAYLPDRPSENLPVNIAYGFKFTLFLSIALPVLFLGVLFLRFPDFRKYMVCRLKRG